MDLRIGVYSRHRMDSSDDRRLPNSQWTLGSGGYSWTAFPLAGHVGESYLPGPRRPLELVRGRLGSARGSMNRGRRGCGVGSFGRGCLSCS
jgi:hypothetical protein